MARWDKYEDWKNFWEQTATEDMKKMHVLAKRVSVESFEEIEDHTV